MLSPEAQEKIGDIQLAMERARRRVRLVCDAEDQPPHPPLRALTLAELFERPAPRYVVDQWIPDRGLVQFVGEPGSLKSFFAMDAGLSIASGLPRFFDYTITVHGPVLYIAAEGGGAFQYRVRVWCYEHRVDPLTVPFHVIPLPVNLRDPGFQQELLAIIEALNPVFVIVDTLARCTPGADENSSKDMGEVVNFCSELQRPSSAAVALIHHPTKHDPKGGGRGSGSIFGAVDTELRVATEDENADADVQDARAITVTCVKQKDDMRPQPLALVGHVVPVRNAEGYEMIHDSGRPITSIVLRLAEIEDLMAQGNKKTASTRALDLAVLTAMRDYAATSQRALRDYANVRQDVVDAAVGRILRAQWAERGKRGQPFVILPEGLRQLEAGK
jgi:AAA domain